MFVSVFLQRKSSIDSSEILQLRQRTEISICRLDVFRFFDKNLTFFDDRSGSGYQPWAVNWIPPWYQLYWVPALILSYDPKRWKDGQWVGNTKVLLSVLLVTCHIVILCLGIRKEQRHQREPGQQMVLYVVCMMTSGRTKLLGSQRLGNIMVPASQLWHL